MKLETVIKLLIIPTIVLLLIGVVKNVNWCRVAFLYVTCIEVVLMVICDVKEYLKNANGKEASRDSGNTE